MKAKLLLSLSLLVMSLSSYAILKSPFKSSVDGITIPNAHSVSLDGDVFRGMAPAGHYDELVSAKVSDILIFKNQTKNEVDKEVAELLKHGYSKAQIHQISFKWHKMKSRESGCIKAVKGLKLIREIDLDPERSLFLHCTVGEDRTGVLSALYRMLNENISMENIFEEEMCQKGYGRGNSDKPWFVINKIRKELTPLFIQIASKIESGELAFDNLDESICSDLKEVSKVERKQFTCSKQF